MKTLTLTYGALALLVVTATGALFLPAPAPSPNVLFICIDDLRPALGCYGNTIVQSPNLDQLASQAYLFTNHFVTAPTCGASRHSMLTGTYPDTLPAISNHASRDLLARRPRGKYPETMVENLRRQGYYTVGIGKISHYVDGLLYDYTEPVGTDWELPHSWDEMLFDAGKWGTGWNAFFGYADGSNRQSKLKQVKPLRTRRGARYRISRWANHQIGLRKTARTSQPETTLLFRSRLLQTASSVQRA